MFTSRARVFVDESKSRGYYLAAAAATPSAVAPLEEQLLRLRAGGRSAIHFNDEGNRRNMLIRKFTSMEIGVRIYVMRGARDVIARPLLIRRLVDDLIDCGASNLTLEQDASVEAVDRRVIFQQLKARDAQCRLEYEHRHRREKPLLWIADAAAWCHQAGGHWPGKFAPIIDQVVEIPAP